MAAVSDVSRLRRQLVIANRILARQGVLDAFGHVSIRHPDHPELYIMSRSRAPQLVTDEDLQTFDRDGKEVDGDTRRPYGERFIHGAIYEARPEVQVVCHNHSPSVIPFGVTGLPLRPVFHMAALMGYDVPVWDIADDFGDTDILVSSVDKGRSLARTLGNRRVALMRGHGCVAAGERIEEVVMTCVYMEENAKLLTTAQVMSNGQARVLSEAEAKLCGEMLQQPLSSERAWECWRTEVGFADEV